MTAGFHGTRDSEALCLCPDLNLAILNVLFFSLHFSTGFNCCRGIEKPGVLDDTVSFCSS